MKREVRWKSGFTIVEVTLAMAFLSVLLITITFLTVHITSIYQKGLSIKAVTTTGQQLVDEFSRAIASSTGLSVSSLCGSKYASGEERDNCEKNAAMEFVYQVRYADPNLLSLPNADEMSDMVPVSGVFCSGRYSYLWNSGYVLNNAYDRARNFSAIMNPGDGSGIMSDFKLLKIVDLDRSLCRDHLEDDSYGYDNFEAKAEEENRTYTGTNIGTIEEVITNSEDNLALYSFDVFRPAVHDLTNHAFYSGTFILATIQGGVDITAQGDYCKDTATMDLDTDFNYCAINKFNFAMRATGETN